MYVSIIRVLIIILSVFLIIVIDPSKWKTGVFALLQKEEFQEVKTYVGVIDRIVKKEAVILVDSTKSDLIISMTELPPHCTTGTWLLINEYSDGTYTMTVQNELTEKNKSKSHYLIQQLLTQ